MKRRVVCVCALMCAWAVFCGGAIARAQTPTGRPTKPEAVAHFKQGNAHYKVRDFEKAVEEYKAGALIEASAIFDYNLGQCYRQLGKYEDAIWHYERYLRSGIATAQELDSIKNWITQMKAEMEQQAKSTPPTEPATMQPESQPAIIQPLAVQKTVEPWHHDAFGWGVTGAGVVVGGIGAALLVDAASLRSDANKAPNQQEQNALHDKADTRALAGGIFVAVGGGLLVTGIVKLAIHDHEAPSTTSTSWMIGLSPNGMFASGRF